MGTTIRLSNPILPCKPLIMAASGAGREAVRQRAHAFHSISRVVAIFPRIASSNTVQKIGKVCSFIPVVSIPFSMYGARNELRNIRLQGQQQLDRYEKINSGLRIVEYVAATGDSLSTLLTALEKIALIAKGALVFASVISGISTILWLASIPLQLRQLAKGKEILAQMNKVINETKITKEGYARALELFSKKHIRAIEQSLNVESGKEVKHTIDKIVQASHRARNVERSEELLKKTVDTLRTRIQQKNFSTKLGILISAVNFIALTILMFSPAAPIGFALLAIGAIVTLAKAIKEYRETSRFEKRLNAITLSL